MLCVPIEVKIIGFEIEVSRVMYTLNRGCFITRKPVIKCSDSPL